MNDIPVKKRRIFIVLKVFLPLIMVILFFAYFFNYKINENSNVTLIDYGKIPGEYSLPDPLRSEIIAVLNSRPEYIYSGGTPAQKKPITKIEIDGKFYSAGVNEIYLYRSWISKKWKINRLTLKLTPHLKNILKNYVRENRERLQKLADQLNEVDDYGE